MWKRGQRWTQSELVDNKWHHAHYHAQNRSIQCAFHIRLEWRWVGRRFAPEQLQNGSGALGRDPLAEQSKPEVKRDDQRVSCVVNVVHSRQHEWFGADGRRMRLLEPTKIRWQFNARHDRHNKRHFWSGRFCYQWASQSRSTKPVSNRPKDQLFTVNDNTRVWQCQSIMYKRKGHISIVGCHSEGIEKKDR